MNVDWDEAAPTPTHMALARLVEAGKVELQTKVREEFTITKKASTRAFSRMKSPTSSAFTFKTLSMLNGWTNTVSRNEIETLGSFNI